jgi:TonB family protein
MKSSLITSFVLHAIFFGTLVLGASFHNPWQKRLPVYQVELVEMPFIKPIEQPKPDKQTIKKSPESVAIQPPKSKEEAIAINKKEPAKEKPESQKEVEPVETKGMEEEKDASSPVASGEVKIEGKNFPFAYYLNLIRYRVRENWEPPYQVSLKKEKINTIIGFKVLRDGRIESINIEIPSGKFLFDQAAQRAILSVGQLPPLPQEFKEEFLVVHIEFEAIW